MKVNSTSISNKIIFTHNRDILIFNLEKKSKFSMKKNPGNVMRACIIKLKEKQIQHEKEPWKYSKYVGVSYIHVMRACIIKLKEKLYV